MHKNSVLAKFFSLFLSLIAVGFLAYYININRNYSNIEGGAPPYGEPEEAVPSNLNTPYDFVNWKRPDGPPRVGLQVGHLDSANFPDELSKLRQNTGTSGGGKAEWEVNKDIAEKVAVTLKSYGVEVDILPATIPPDYIADAFIAIHADGSLDKSVTGYKIAPPWRDWTGKSQQLSNLIKSTYGATTGLRLDPNISRNMRGYYAFSWWRYDHSIHPMTPAVIVETGFLTSPSDQKLLINNSQVAADGITKGIVQFLAEQNLLDY